MDEEIFDVVNEQDEVIGSASRDECHEKRLLHRAAHVLVFNAKGELLLQKRSRTIATHPMRWTSAASGHVDAGETYEVAAMREAREELGIRIAKAVFAFKVRPYAGVECGFVGAFLAKSEGPFTINEGEVDRVQFFPVDEALRQDLTPTTRAVMDRFVAERARMDSLLQSL